DLRTKYMLDKDLGFATKFIDPDKRITYPTLYYLALKQASLQKLLAEEMRVLYVAMTRAKEKLVMIGNVSSMEKLIDDWAVVANHETWVLPMKRRKKAKTYLDWVGPALVRHQQNEKLRNNEQVIDIVEEVMHDPSNWKIEIIAAESLTNMENEQ